MLCKCLGSDCFQKLNITNDPTGGKSKINYYQNPFYPTKHKLLLMGFFLQSIIITQDDSDIIKYVKLLEAFLEWLLCIFQLCVPSNS